MARDGVLHVRRQHAAAGAALYELVAACVVCVRVSVYYAVHAPAAFRDDFQDFAPGVLVVAGVYESHLFVIHAIYAYVCGSFYVPAFFAGLDKFVHFRVPPSVCSLQNYCTARYAMILSRKK